MRTFFFFVILFVVTRVAIITQTQCSLRFHSTILSILALFFFCLHCFVVCFWVASPIAVACIWDTFLSIRSKKSTVAKMFSSAYRTQSLWPSKWMCIWVHTKVESLQAICSVVREKEREREGERETEWRRKIKGTNKYVQQLRQRIIVVAVAQVVC